MDTDLSVLVSLQSQEQTVRMAHLPLSQITGFLQTVLLTLFFGAKRDNKEVAGEVSSVGFVFKFVISGTVTREESA